jgi:uncharacterized YkwD family protein
MRQERYGFRVLAIILAMMLLVLFPAGSVSSPDDTQAVLPAVSCVASNSFSVGNQTFRIRVEFAPLGQPSVSLPKDVSTRTFCFTINGKTYYLPFNVSMQPVGTTPTATPSMPAPVPVPSVPAPAPVPTQAPRPSVPAPTPAPAPSTSSTTMTTEEQQMLSLVNEERGKLGLAPLKADMRLVVLARQKSQDMIDKNYFSHTSPTYGSPFDMMSKAGITYRTAGENLAGSFSVPSAHEALMRSDGHRRNILNPAFTHIGIGIVRGGKYGLMITQMFIGL